jgi:hypothetical protein
MALLRTTAGQLLVNEHLPPELRDYQRKLDKKTLSQLLAQVARDYPEKYREISHALARTGSEAAYFSGGDSFGLEHVATSPRAQQHYAELQARLDRLDADSQLTPDQHAELTTRAVGALQEHFAKDLLAEAVAEGNPLARQVTSGARGTANNLAALRGGDLLYTDSAGRAIPVPITRGLSAGLTPAQYWAGSYGARTGLVDVKLGTAKAGYLNKQLGQAAHRLLVTAVDADLPGLRGLPSTPEDQDNAGALLAAPAGGYPRNTVLTPKLLRELSRQGVRKILVRSPLVGGAADGGVLARDLGIREQGELPLLGEQVGITAAQALGEPLSQGSLSSKHSGGVAGTRQAISGFQLVNQLVQVPQSFKGGATHAQRDGVVQDITAAPAGGQYVVVDEESHYVAPGHTVQVQRGQRVEAGDTLSDGIPNPAEIVRHKGIGEGRRYFTTAFRQAFQGARLPVNRRNVELLGRGLIDHVRLTEPHQEWLPGDVVSYQSLENTWQPREGSQEVAPAEAVGKYLERPVLHHSVGTRVRPSLLADLSDYGVDRVTVHADPPPFEPEMIRGADNLSQDPDWLVKMFGSNLRRNLLHDVHRGAVSKERGTSFVPSLAHGVNFGNTQPIVPPHREKAAAPAGPSPLYLEALQLWKERMARMQAQLEAYDANRLIGEGSRETANWNLPQRLLNPYADSLGHRPALPVTGQQVADAAAFTPGPLGWTAFGADAASKLRDWQQARAASQAAREYYDSAVPRIPDSFDRRQQIFYQLPEVGPHAQAARAWNQQSTQPTGPSDEATLGLLPYWQSLRNSPEVTWPEPQKVQAIDQRLQGAQDDYKRRFALSNKVVQELFEDDRSRLLSPQDQHRQRVLQGRWAQGDLTDEEFTGELSQLYPYYTGNAFSANVPEDTRGLAQIRRYTDPNWGTPQTEHVRNPTYNTARSVAAERAQLAAQEHPQTQSFAARQLAELERVRAANPPSPQLELQQALNAPLAAQGRPSPTAQSTQEFLAAHPAPAVDPRGRELIDQTWNQQGPRLYQRYGTPDQREHWAQADQLSPAQLGQQAARQPRPPLAQKPPTPPAPTPPRQLFARPAARPTPAAPSAVPGAAPGLAGSRLPAVPGG